MSAWAPGAWAPGAWRGTAWTDAAPVEVPDVVGQLQADATTTLEGAGFVVQVTTAASSTVPAGYVISQVPPGGSLATEGSTVTIVVSTGDVVPVDPLLLGGKRKKKGHKNISFKAASDAVGKPEVEPPAPKPAKKASGLFLGLLDRLVKPEGGLDVPPKPPELPAEKPPETEVVVVVEAVAAPAAGTPAAADVPVNVPAPDPVLDEVKALREQSHAQQEQIKTLEATVVHMLAALEQRLVAIHHDLSITLPADSPVTAPEPVAKKLTGDELAAENLRRAKSLAGKILGGHV